MPATAKRLCPFGIGNLPSNGGAESCLLYFAYSFFSTDTGSGPRSVFQVKRFEKMGALDKTIIGFVGISSRGNTAIHKLLIENINYSPSLLKPFIKSGFCNLCLDIGHLILGGESVSDILEDNFSVIREIHIHGVKGYEDHLCVSRVT
jgi:hypothetical protein